MYPMNTLGQWVNSKRGWWITLGLLCGAIMALLILPYREWGFLHDDFGFFYATRVSSWADVWHMLTTTSSDQCIRPLDAPVNLSFFSTLFRPVTFLIQIPQEWLFGFNPYPYFVVSGLLHVANTILFAFLMRPELGYQWSLIVAGLFAFHPTIGWWFGLLSVQHEVFSLTLILLAVLWFSWSMQKTNSWLWYGASLAAFFTAMLTREHAVVFPLWILGACWLKGASWRQAFYTSGGFWTVLGGVALLRWLALPFGSFKSGAMLEFLIDRFNIGFLDRVTLVADLLGLAWMAGGQRILKGFLILAISAALLGMFLVIQNRTQASVWLLGAFLLLWPCLLHHSARYLYELLPFFLAGCAHIFLEFRPYLAYQWRVFGQVATILFVCFTAWYNRQIFAARESDLATVHRGFAALAQDRSLDGKEVIMAAAPERLFPQSSAQQALILYGGSPKTALRNSCALNLYHTASRKCGPLKLVSTVPRATVHSVKLINGTVRITSTDEDTAWLEETIWNGKKKDYHLGPVVVRDESDTCSFDTIKKVRSIDCLLHEPYRPPQAVIITWDYEHQKFVKVASEHGELSIIDQREHA